MKRTKIAAIDVGTTKVCTIMADSGEGDEPRILGFGTQTYPGLEKTTRINPASILQSVKRAERMAGYKIRSAVVNISGSHVSSVNQRGIVSIPHSNEQVQANDRRRALEVAQSVEIPGDRRLIHVIPRTYVLDGQAIRDPVGLYGFRLDVETHIVTAGTTSVENLVTDIMNVGIGIDNLVLTSLASAEAVLTDDERDGGIMMADIGGFNTDVAIFKGGSVHHTFMIPVGGHHITNDIALGMGLTPELAERMKRAYGQTTLPEDGDSSRTIEVEKGHQIYYQELNDIIRARVEELFRLILLNMPSGNHADLIPRGMVITGATASLPGIEQLVHRITRLPVRIGRPVDLNGGDEALYSPDYATSVGLLYWKTRNEGKGNEAISRTGWQVSLPKWLGYFRHQKVGTPS